MEKWRKLTVFFASLVLAGQRGVLGRGSLDLWGGAALESPLRYKPGFYARE